MKVEISEKLLTEGQSDKGGWNAAQLSLIGVAWPPVSGWKSLVIGKSITASDAAQFVALRTLAKGRK